MKTTKNTFLKLLFSGALLTAGLFYFSKSKNSSEGNRLSKPSQLTFKSGNQLSQPEKIVPDKSETNEKTQIKNETNTSVISSLNNLSESEKKKWSDFEEILQSKNDNDPRLNTELKNMSPVFHTALFEKYENIANENRNARGTIVFLIARDLKNTDDVDFITKIYQEPPCLSLDDCKNPGSDDPHHSGINQTTLIYPQLAGLYQIEQQLMSRPEILNNPTVKNGIVTLLKQAESFPVLAVQQKAQEIQRKFRL